MRTISRREFVKAAGLGVTALMLPPGFTRRATAAACVAEPVLVVVFLRGGADGINLVIPRMDPAYETVRTSIKIPPNPALKLDPDNDWEFHPSLAPLLGMYGAGQLCVVHAVGGTNRYSHFEAMDAMEFVSPVPGSAPRPDGWLHAALKQLVGPSPPPTPPTVLRGLSLSTHTISALTGVRGSFTYSLALPSAADFKFNGDGPTTEALFQQMSYPNGSLASSRERVKHEMEGLLAALPTISAAAQLAPESAYAGVPTHFADSLRDAARLIKQPGSGVSVIAIDLGGWDHHYNENNLLANQAGFLANGLASFYEDIGPTHYERVMTLCMTEFGRTAFQRGSGTDHGYGSVMFAAGGKVDGGRVLSRLDLTAPPGPERGIAGIAYSDELADGGWPGLGNSQLHVQPDNPGDPRDLDASTDFREVMAEVLVHHMGLPAGEVYGAADPDDESVVLGDYDVPTNGLGLFGPC